MYSFRKSRARSAGVSFQLQETLSYRLVFVEGTNKSSHLCRACSPASCLCYSMQLTDVGIHQAAARGCICAIRRRNKDSPTTSESASFKKVCDKEDVARQNEMTTAHAYERILHTHLLGRSNTYMRCRLAGCHGFMRVLITSHTFGLLVRQGYKNRPSLALNFQITGRAFQNPSSVVGAMAEEQKANKVHLPLHTVSGNIQDKCTLV